MQRWEYLDWHDSLGRKGKLPSYDIDRSTFLGAFLNDLGAQGWDLVAASNTGETHSRWILKRPAGGSA